MNQIHRFRCYPVPSGWRAVCSCGWSTKTLWADTTRIEAAAHATQHP